ncbi:phosphopantetheine-binding protein [Alteromonas sp. 1_MG-2023]|jgi:acyl carrier protein|uniref:phosphopantetheine-binding protein n=1 Tax=Alteromonas sp. 1_MG-2023 TaxID=3062669 RepID=UPI0026E3D35E|nr:phosphopantetheine-binding protein [Alteromonas sp. 1_MG-2023]MDO6566974.1 phosphopantetheine-binding protein [Alteromonas sp. 1_MG-2023]
MTALQNELKLMIIECLDLEDIDATEIDDADPLFVDGLGLDSIDALEIGLALQKRYGIKLDSNSDETRAHFASINALADLVKNHKSI